MNVRHALSVLLCLTGISVFLVGCNRSAARSNAHGQSVTAPSANIVIRRSGMQTFEVMVDRKDHREAVKMELTHLPAGVRAKTPSMKVETDKATFVLDAAPDAALVTNHQAKLLTTGPDGATTTQYVSITVTESSGR